MVAFGPIMAASAGMGALSIFGASSQNRAIAKAAKRNIRALQSTITQIRFDRIRQTHRLARDAAISVGGAVNALPRSQAVIETLASRIAGGVASDQFAIDENRDRGVTHVRQQQKAIATQANSQMSSPIVSGITGAFQGAQFGMNLASGIQSLQAASKMAPIQLAAEAANLSGAKAFANYWTNMLNNTQSLIEGGNWNFAQ